MNGTTKKTDNSGQPKPAKRVRKRNFRVSPEGKRHTIPFPQRERVKLKYMAGKKLREIAREEQIDRTSVAKIVREPDVAKHVQDLREKFYGRLEEALEAAFDYVKNGKEGGRLAYQMMMDSGIVRGSDKLDVAAPIEVETEESAVKRIAVALVQGAIERHKSFGLPLPEADEVEEELEKITAKKGSVE